MWRPARGAWRNLLPGDSPTEFRDAEDEAAYHDSVALQEYETLDVRKFVLALQKRDPREVRAVSLAKLLWELPGLAGSTTTRGAGERDVAEAIGTAARTVLIRCAGFKKVTASAGALERLLLSRDKDPLVVFLARLLDVPSTPLSEAASAVLLSLIRSEGRVAPRDCGAMDMGELTRLLLLRVSQVLVARAVEEEEEESDGAGEHGRRFGGADTLKHARLSPHAYQQGFELLQIVLELYNVPRAVAWLRQGMIHLTPDLIGVLVPEGAHGVIRPPHGAVGGGGGAAAAGGRGGDGGKGASLVYSRSCRDLDCFEILCRILCKMSTDPMSAAKIAESKFVATWFWMIKMRAVNAEGAFGHGDEPEQQRRVVRAFWDVLWEWSYHPVIRQQYTELFFEAAFGGGDGGDGDGGGNTDESTKAQQARQDSDASSPIQVEDALDVILRHIDPDSDLAMHACGIFWNCFEDASDIEEFQPVFLERGIVNRMGSVLLRSDNAGVLTCCIGALRNLVQTDTLTFHVTSLEGVVDRIRALRDKDTVEALIRAQKMRMEGDPAVKFRGGATELSSEDAASALSGASSVIAAAGRLREAARLALKRIMGEDDVEEMSAIQQRWGR
jgi:hypothetical protein